LQKKLPRKRKNLLQMKIPMTKMKRNQLPSRLPKQKMLPRKKNHLTIQIQTVMMKKKMLRNPKRKLQPQLQKKTKVRTLVAVIPKTRMTNL
jgi:hypothetical protein